MKPGRAILAAILVLGTAAPAAAQQTPLQLFQQLIRPPVNAVTNAFRPQPKRPPAPPQEPKEAETVDLLSVPMPRPRPEPTDPALGYAPIEAPITAAPVAPTPEAAVEAAPVPAAPAAATVAPIIEAPVAEVPTEPAAPGIPTPRPRPPVKTANLGPPLTLPPPAARSTCGMALTSLGVELTPLKPVSEGSCGIPSPVAVASLEDGAVDFTTKAIIGCDLAEKLARWTRDTVQPIAMKTLGQRVTGYRIAASYACRTRDNIPGAKLSEHAHGNAIDISAFRVEGLGWIDVKTGWPAGGAQTAFLKAVRKSACGPFTTVLGPGSDVYHADHFHLDRAKRRTAGPSKGLYCH